MIELGSGPKYGRCRLGEAHNDPKLWPAHWQGCEIFEKVRNPAILLQLAFINVKDPTTVLMTTLLA